MSTNVKALTSANSVNVSTPWEVTTASVDRALKW